MTTPVRQDNRRMAHNRTLMVTGGLPVFCLVYACNWTAQTRTGQMYQQFYTVPEPRQPVDGVSGVSGDDHRDRHRRLGLTNRKYQLAANLTF